MTLENNSPAAEEPTDLFDKGSLMFGNECQFKKCCKKYKKKGKYCRNCPKL
ncbi:MAG: hypothetical protein WA958_14555 [Tunicatimonas sp.]